MTAVDCFLLEDADAVTVRLRRYHHVDGSGWTCAEGYHNVSSEPIARIEHPSREEATSGDLHDHSDPAWPIVCTCGYTFVDADNWQRSTRHLYRRADDHTVEYDEQTMPAGAIRWADWMPTMSGIGGWIVRLPDLSDWTPDRRASNCTMPDDDVHRCWVIHGEAPMLHVDKDGVSCAAGAGSIQTGKWHGFLRHGQLVE